MKFSKHFQIGTKWIGEGEPCFVVAEIGLNHNGSVELAKKLVKKAKECNADAVKFQKRSVKAILTKKGLNQPYNNWYSFGETYGEHRKALELSEESYRELKRLADETRIIFFASAWDKQSVDFLETLNVPAYKIASACVTDLPLVEYTAKKNKPVVMSTGMSTMEEIEEAVNTVSKYDDEFVLLHCVSTYPSDFAEINLRVMNTLRKRFDCLVGYSGHELSICVSEVAAVLGACMVERHFTLDRAMKGPDHAASLEPTGLFKLIRDIRDIETSMGNGQKKIVSREMEIRRKLAKSVVASCEIKKGQTINSRMLRCKSPALGLKPKFIPKLVGKTVKTHVLEDEYIQLEDVA